MALRLRVSVVRYPKVVNSCGNLHVARDRAAPGSFPCLGGMLSLEHHGVGCRVRMSRWARVLVVIAALGFPFVGAPLMARAADGKPVLWRQAGEHGWTEWAFRGTRVESGAVVLDRTLSAQESRDGAMVLLGSLIGPEQPGEFEELIPSWNAHTPTGTWIETYVRIRTAGTWSQWYAMGAWSSDGESGRRRSVSGQQDDQARVLTDTLRARGVADAYQVRVDLLSSSEHSPELTHVAVVTSFRAAPRGSTRTVASVPAVSLDVPERSQMIYPGGGEVWCSPTSTSMVMAYWANMLNDASLDRAVPDVATGTYDPVYRGNGNWPFNTAYAGAAGLRAYVSRAGSLQEVEPWLNAGVPVVASLGWAAGQLPEAPIASTNGHLLVITGVTERGDVIVNDPAADPRRGQRVRRVYNRASFESLWLSHSGGTVYLIHPADYPVPQ